MRQTTAAIAGAVIGLSLLGIAYAGEQVFGGVRLPGSAGTAGHVLTSGGAAAPCTWAAASAAGKAAIHYPPPAGIATIGSSGTTATLDTRGFSHVLDLDDSTAEGIEFKGIMPESYGGGALTLTFEYGFTSADSGNAIAAVSVMSVTPGTDSPASYSFDTAKNLTLTSTGSLTIYTGTISFSNAEADDVNAGETMLTRFVRDSAGDNDTASGDLELRGLWWTED